MHIYLRHPVHGTKVAISDAEAASDEENGWKRFDIDNPTPITDSASNALATRRRRTSTEASKES
jgi:hypothetical protein